MQSQNIILCIVDSVLVGIFKHSIHGQYGKHDCTANVVILIDQYYCIKQHNNRHNKVPLVTLYCILIPNMHYQNHNNNIHDC